MARWQEKEQPAHRLKDPAVPLQPTGLEFYCHAKPSYFPRFATATPKELDRCFLLWLFVIQQCQTVYILKI